MCVRCVGTVHLQRFAIKTKFLDQVELRKSALQMPKNISKTSQTMGKLIVPQHSTSFLQSVHWDPCKTKRKKTLQKHNNKWCNRALRTLDCILCDYDMLVYSHTLFLYTSTAFTILQFTNLASIIFLTKYWIFKGYISWNISQFAPILEARNQFHRAA